ncbi:MAG: hypothetical protein ACON46_04400 [Coraliomargaritaceae bacterium]
MREIICALDEADAEDPEHPDIALVHDASGWSISLYPSGVATLEKIGEDETPPSFIPNMNRTQAFSLWCQLAEGRIEAIQQLDWKKPREA